MTGRDAWIAAGLVPPGETPRTLADWLIRAIIPENANDVTGPAVAILSGVANDLATLGFYWTRADMERGELPGAEFVIGLKLRVEAAIQVLRGSEGAPPDAAPRGRKTARKKAAREREIPRSRTGRTPREDAPITQPSER